MVRRYIENISRNRLAFAFRHSSERQQTDALLAGDLDYSYALVVVVMVVAAVVVPAVSK